MMNLVKDHYDLLIIGGGINGCGIARDAAGRGLSVLLCEQDDLAEHTSSRSTKLIHGGLRYLEYYEFRLVREALAERDVLLSIAPHLVHPMQFIIPHDARLRPRWLIRLGLWLYDHLGWHWHKTSRIPHSSSITSKEDSGFFNPLHHHFNYGFSYYDCQVDDARLVVLNAQHAAQKGATILTHTRFISAERNDNYWDCIIETPDKQKKTIKTKALINAAGPWVDNIIQHRLRLQSKHHIKLVKGSHIVTRKLYEGSQAYLLQHDDKRVIFAIPYQENFTLIGTTDLTYVGNPRDCTVEPAERDYLCNIINHYFQRPITPDDIVYEWAGVRPLQADDAANPSAVTRDYVLEREDKDGHAPLLSIFGGKITTYRELAEHALTELSSYFPDMGLPWTAHTVLPGGQMGKPAHYLKLLNSQHPNLPITLLKRLIYTYGATAESILNTSQIVSDLGQHFGSDLYQAEVDYLYNAEWARTADDILWRRTKLGLTESIDKTALALYLTSLSMLD